MLLETCKGQDIEDEVYRKKNRMKLSRQEQDYLEKKFVTNPFKWPKAVFKGLAKEMNLPSSKIYKWNWDRRLKARKQLNKVKQSETVAQRGLELLKKMN